MAGKKIAIVLYIGLCRGLIDEDRALNTYFSIGRVNTYPPRQLA